MTATTRDQNKIRAELDHAQKEYDAKAGEAERVWRPLSDRVRDLRRELAECLCPGACPCSRCGGQPVGLRHVRGAAIKGGKVMFRHVYEVGCTACHDAPEDDRRGFGETQARAAGPELDALADRAIADAVEMWNEKNGAGGPAERPDGA